MLRTVIGIIVGIILLFGAFTLAKSLIDSNTRPKREVPQAVKKVYTRPVINGEVPIMVNANGNLVASDRVELFAEVEGIFQYSAREFKAGERFQKNQILLQIDSREFSANLVAQRSALYDQIAAMMPDLKFDFPEAFQRWNDYLNAFDLQENTKQLPEINSEKERFFVTGQQIITTFYQVRSLEERLDKFVIRAPFDGILTENLVNKGSLVRSGQKLGEFISLREFELELAVGEQYREILEVGKKVKLTNLDNSREWDATVKRVNGRVDQETQTITAFIGVSGQGLIEGMYMEANIAAKPEQNAVEIERTLLLNEKDLFVVQGGELIIKEITPVYYTDKTAVVKGLDNGDQLVVRPIAGGYAGMPIEMVTETEIDK
ncbi:MAG: HlyD family efflux transporter periplasmic adaptor subunit [Bacteroidota bacterium]